MRISFIYKLRFSSFSFTRSSCSSRSSSMKSNRSSDQNPLNSFSIQWLEALGNSEQKDIQMTVRQHRLSVCAAICKVDLSQKLSFNNANMLYPSPMKLRLVRRIQAAFASSLAMGIYLTIQNKSYWLHSLSLPTDTMRVPDRSACNSH